MKLNGTDVETDDIYIGNNFVVKSRDDLLEVRQKYLVTAQSLNDLLEEAAMERASEEKH